MLPNHGKRLDGSTHRETSSSPLALPYHFLLFVNSTNLLLTNNTVSYVVWGLFQILPRAFRLFTIFSPDMLDVERFFQASKRQVPSFSVKFHPSVQNRSTLQLIYQVPT